MFDFAIAGVEAPPFLLILVGFTAGMVGGFVGVGGGYMVTPALIVFGFPGYMASGIDMTHITGKSIISTIRHRKLGNVDWTLGLTMVVGTMLGVEIGIGILEHFKQLGVSTPAVLTASLIVMLGILVYLQWETRKAHQELQKMGEEGTALDREHTVSTIPRIIQRIALPPRVRCKQAGVTISMWVIVLVGVVTGILAGFLGVGGGFVRVPALVYLVGAPTHIAVGTDLLEIALSGAYGTLRHSMQGNVDFAAVMFLISGAALGAQFGSIATVYVRGPAIRYVLSYSLILACLGAIIRLVSELMGNRYHFLTPAATVLTLGEMLFLCMFIMSLVWFALRANKGRWIPYWAAPLIVGRAPATVTAGGSSRKKAILVNRGPSITSNREGVAALRIKQGELMVLESSEENEDRGDREAREDRVERRQMTVMDKMWPFWFLLLAIAMTAAYGIYETWMNTGVKL